MTTAAAECPHNCYRPGDCDGSCQHPDPGGAAIPAEPLATNATEAIKKLALVEIDLAAHGGFDEHCRILCEVAAAIRTAAIPAEPVDKAKTLEAQNMTLRGEVARLKAALIESERIRHDSAMAYAKRLGELRAKLT